MSLPSSAACTSACCSLGTNSSSVATCKISNSGDQQALRELYGQFSDAREAAGRGKLSYPKFLKGINAQADRLQKDGKCAEIELSLVVLGDKVQLKARAGR